MKYKEKLLRNKIDNLKIQLSECEELLKIFCSKNHGKPEEAVIDNITLRLLKRKFCSMKERCNDPRAVKYKYYGGKGIKCVITLDEMASLWIRDDAESMDWPTIDRINPNDDYRYDNCRFIERSENCNRKTKTPEQKRQKLLNYYAKKKSLGLCRVCRSPKFNENIYCNYHRILYLDRARERYAEKYKNNPRHTYKKRLLVR